MQETLTACPACHHTLFENKMEVIDHTVSNQTFHITGCTRCGLLFTNPRPDKQSIGAYYHSEQYISHHSQKKDPLTLVYNAVRKYTTRSKISLVKRHTPANRPLLLDYGCGTGYFLHACKQQGWNTWGIEPDQDAAHLSAKENQGNVYTDLSLLPAGDHTFDVITLWHVLEHVHELHLTLDILKAKLKPGGTLVIAVPNPDSYDAIHYGNNWAAYDVPRHLYHFTKPTLRQLLETHGLHLRHIEPMWFDAFYVSLLSSGYQYGKTKPVEAFLTGLKSNLAGNKKDLNSVNTSSLIYILNKPVS